MKQANIPVTGMYCGMCEAHVNDVVRRIKGVKKVSSSHSKNLTEVVYEDGLDLEEVLEAIKGQGYDVGEPEVSEYEKKGFFGKLFGK